MGSQLLKGTIGVVLVMTLVVALVTRLRDGGGASGAEIASVKSSQRAAASAFHAAGAKLEVDDKGRVIGLVARGPRFTDSLASQLSALPDLRDVQIEGSSIATAGMAALGQLSRLESLRLDKTKISDADMMHLGQIQSLKELFLSHCPIGDAGLTAIQDLQNLKLLDLSHSRVTDDGLAKLGVLRALKRLYLKETAVTGTGLAAFQNSHPLSLLNLSNCPVTFEGIANLGRFSSLQSLYLDGVAFDNAMLVRLIDVLTESVTHLNGLFLSRTPLTDSAIEPLSSLAELNNLSLVGLNETGISKSAFKELASQTPEIRYLVDYPPGVN